MGGNQIEIASVLLASSPEWSEDASEARFFVESRMPVALREGLASAQQHLNLYDGEADDDEYSEEPSEYDDSESHGSEPMFPFTTDDENEDMFEMYEEQDGV